MENLYKKPRFWLTLKTSQDIFERARPYIQFDEPIPPFDTRFPGKLEGILESVRQTYERKHLNPTVLDAAASYFYQLISGHPFQNGNKRIAVLLTHFFLLIHNVDFTVSYLGLYNFAVVVAKLSSEFKPFKIKGICKEIIGKFTADL